MDYDGDDFSEFIKIKVECFCPRFKSFKKFTNLARICPILSRAIEKGHKVDVPDDVLERIAEVLKLTENETTKMRELATESRVYAIATDYINSNECVRRMMCEIQAAGARDSDWIKFAETLKQRNRTRDPRR